MTGKLREGKMSIFIRDRARALPRTMARTATMTVYGRRRAKMIGFMAVDLPPRNPSPGPLPEAERGRQTAEAREKGRSPRPSCPSASPLRFGEGAGGRGFRH